MEVRHVTSEEPQRSGDGSADSRGLEKGPRDSPEGVPALQGQEVGVVNETD